MNCFIYCRKSTEDKARQVQSIGDQKKIMTELAKSRGLKICEVFIDEKSAGKPYQRPAYQKMIGRINNGEARIIISWKIDRLSRNPVENGQLSWMLQQGIISEIIVSDRSYLPQDNVLLFMMEGAMANQYLRDLSTNVKRGMKSRIEKGFFQGKAPMGYLNHGNQRGNKTIIPDPKYFPLVKKLWKLLLTGNYQLAEVYRIMKRKYPLYRKGKLLSFSSFHKIFHNPFYCGLFKWSGEKHLGVHEKMITQREFETVQGFLHKKQKTRERNLLFDFKGIFSCGTCNACITAERKTKFIVATQSEKSFDYYRCVHRKRDVECYEKPLSKDQIEIQLSKELRRLYLPEEVIDFGIDKLGERKGRETQLQASSSFNLKREIQSLKRKKEQIEENLVLEADSEIRSLMKRKYEETKISIQKLDDNYESLQEEIENNQLRIINTLRVIKNAQKILESGTIEDKKILLNHLGTDWKIKGKRIGFKPHFVSEAVLQTKEFIQSKNGVSEPSTNLFDTSETLTSEEVSFIWYTLWRFIKNSVDFQNKG